MRLILATSVLSLLSIAAMAQPIPTPDGGRGITRDQFVQRAADAAGRRFDQIDTGHTGIITRAQIQTWRQAHQGVSGAQQPTFPQ